MFLVLNYTSLISQIWNYQKKFSFYSKNHWKSEKIEKYICWQAYYVTNWSLTDTGFSLNEYFKNQNLTFQNMSFSLCWITLSIITYSSHFSSSLSQKFSSTSSTTQQQQQQQFLSFISSLFTILSGNRKKFIESKTHVLLVGTIEKILRWLDRGETYCLHARVT